MAEQAHIRTLVDADLARKIGDRARIDRRAEYLSRIALGALGLSALLVLAFALGWIKEAR